jgi:hypothetical protein
MSGPTACFGTSDMSSTAHFYSSSSLCTAPVWLTTQSTLYLLDPWDLQTWLYQSFTVSGCESPCIMDVAFSNWNFVSGYHYRIIGTHYWVGIIPNPGFSLLDVYVQ